MDAKIIENINNIVQPNDFLYFLGDWCFARREEFSSVAEGYRNRINCKNIVLIFGNHDKRGRNDPKFLKLFNSCHDILEVNDNKQKIILCHYPLLSWEKSKRGSYMLFGHCHSNLNEFIGSKIPEAKMLDTGIDNAAKILADYRPFSFKEIVKIMTRKNSRVVN